MTLPAIENHYSLVRTQLSTDCNPNDILKIRDFKGYLTFIYAQKTDEPQDVIGNLTPMSEDFGGYNPFVTIRSKALPYAMAVPLKIFDEIYLPDCIGSEIEISYNPIDFVTAIFSHAYKAGHFTNAG